MGNGPDTLRPRPDGGISHFLHKKLPASVAVPVLLLGGGGAASVLVGCSNSIDQDTASPPGVTAPRTPGQMQNPTAMLNCLNPTPADIAGIKAAGITIRINPTHGALTATDADTPDAKTKITTTKGTVVEFGGNDMGTVLGLNATSGTQTLRSESTNGLGWARCMTAAHSPSEEKAVVETAKESAVTDMRNKINAGQIPGLTTVQGGLVFTSPGGSTLSLGS